jgi:D-alanyl-D-alanine carboxypeptidase
MVTGMVHGRCTSIAVSLALASVLGSACEAGQPRASKVDEERHAHAKTSCVGRAGRVPRRYRPVVRALCAELHNNGDVGASIAILEEGELWSLGVGRRCVDGEEPMQGGDPSRIGSLTKLVTAALAAQMALEGRIDLDEDLAELIPELERPMTMRQLLHHRSGLRDPTLFDFGGGRDWLSVLTDLPRDSTDYHYANINYALVGLALARHGERDYEALVRDFAPELVFESPPDAACGHLASGVGMQRVEESAMPFPSWSRPAGGVFASAEDLVRLGARLDADRITETLAREPVPVPGEDPYGLAVHVGERAGRLHLHHSGNTGFHTAELHWLAADETRSTSAVAVLVNGPHHYRSTVEAALSALTVQRDR